MLAERVGRPRRIRRGAADDVQVGGIEQEEFFLDAEAKPLAARSWVIGAAPGDCLGKTPECRRGSFFRREVPRRAADPASETFSLVSLAPICVVAPAAPQTHDKERDMSLSSPLPASSASPSPRVRDLYHALLDEPASTSKPPASSSTSN